MHIRGQAYQDKARKRRQVRSSRTADVSQAGRHYLIVDNEHRNRDTDTMHTILGEDVTLKDGLGVVDDQDVALAAASQGLTVIEREKKTASGKTFWTMPEMPWRKGDTT